ncbi:MAG: hypothetical protein AAGF83_07370 [Cyanobacteria bacterium P01_G01_bin.67]
MSNFQIFVIKILVGLGAILLNICFILPAYAVTQELQINGDRGYQVQTIFSYDEREHSKALAKQERDVIEAIDNLRVSFYDPSGSMIASYDNIVDGVAQGSYFEFHYDPIKQKLWGEIDLGGETVGEMYLKGNVAEELALIKVEASGEEKIVDRLSASVNR